MTTFAPAKWDEVLETDLETLHFDKRFGAFVYRLVLKIFILARGVRLPYALLIQKHLFVIAQ